jgi:hypothetical protein
LVLFVNNGVEKHGLSFLDILSLRIEVVFGQQEAEAIGHFSPEALILHFIVFGVDADLKHRDAMVRDKVDHLLLF